MIKGLAILFGSVVGVATSTFAQTLPNYVPTTGLVGWWPFDGHANDESGNGHHGAVFEFSDSTDRFENINSALFFDGMNDFVQIPHDEDLNSLPLSVSFWMKSNAEMLSAKLFNKVCCSSWNGWDIESVFASTEISSNWHFEYYNQTCEGIYQTYCSDVPYPIFQSHDDVWHHCVFIVDSMGAKVYWDGELAHEQGWDGPPIAPVSTVPLEIARYGLDNNLLYHGLLDDVGIWGSALTEDQVLALFTATECDYDVNIAPGNAELPIGSTAIFSADSPFPNPTYTWQSDFGQGFQSLVDFGNYSGTATSTLAISNIQLSAHNQLIRVLVSAGECSDTSDVAVITLADTCLFTILDTVLISVTDTLVIDAMLSGIFPPNNMNTIKIYPNPASDFVTIDYGNFELMVGYQLNIENSLGQQIFSTTINQQSDYLSLDNWGGSGLYFVNILSPQGEIIDSRKILLQ